MYEDETIVAFPALLPLAPGHALVVPKSHHNSITTVPLEEQARMFHVAAEIGGALLRAVDADGFNLLLANGTCAGQLVPHACLQVIPRNPEDALVFPVNTIQYSSAEEQQQLLMQIRRKLQHRLP